MLTRNDIHTHCEAQAVLCELMASEVRDTRLATEWRLMASDWRAAAFPEANDNEDAVGPFARRLL